MRNEKKICDGEVGGSGGCVNVIYSRPKVANDVVSSQDVFRDLPGLCYLTVNVGVASFISLRENRMQPFIKCENDGKVYL